MWSISSHVPFADVTTQVRTEFPHSVHVIPHTWIPVQDVRLAARMWLPEDAGDGEAVPGILEYLPYRKGDHMAARDARLGTWFAGHGYAYARVDIRGTGDSEGIILDEYLPQEQLDAVEVISWLAAQPWCSGSVGMSGISWGGFNGLQIAARRRPELKAVISMCSTDDRYADDVHYLGGCLLADEQLPWASVMFALNALPPDPRAVGEGWRQMWLQRLERTPPFIEAWMEHQRRDAFWKQGSVCEDYGAIECPVYMVGGWADGYTNSVLRFLEGSPGIRKGLIGPWPHAFPQRATPGPSIGFLQECVRWWDRWLKGIENGIDREPMLRAWMQEPLRPEGLGQDRPGRWVVEEHWPSPAIERRRLPLGDGVLGLGADIELVHVGSQPHGLLAGAWCPYGIPGDFPPEQREEDALCLTFDGEPLTERIELLGRPRLRLELSVDRPNALVVARLCDVAPDGTSTLLSRGALNLTHRDGHEDLQPMVPGERVTVELELDVMGQALEEGHRFRLAVSTTYWPWLWPSPEVVTLTVHSGHLDLPVRPAGSDGAAPPGFAPAEEGPSLETETLESTPAYRTIVYDVVGRAWTLEFNHDGRERERLVDQDLELESDLVDRRTIRDGDPLSAEIRCERRYGVAFGRVSTRVETVSTMTADARDFHLVDTLEVFENDHLVFSKTWDRRVRRDLV